jgi:hypothetical protein
MANEQNHDEQNRADQVDENVLGATPFDDTQTGIAGYPPERPLGVEDPGLLEGSTESPDDLTLRNWRHGGGRTEQGVRVMPADGDDPAADSVKQAIADDAIVEEHASAEEAAMHVVDRS